MKVQSNILSSASGKLSGCVFRTTRHGVILQAKSSPRERTYIYNNSLISENVQRGLPSRKQFISIATRAWQVMTDAQRESFRNPPPPYKDYWKYFLTISYRRYLSGKDISAFAPSTVSTLNYITGSISVSEGFLRILATPIISPLEQPLGFILISDHYIAPVSYPVPLYFFKPKKGPLVQVPIRYTTEFEPFWHDPQISMYFYMKAYALSEDMTALQTLYDGWVEGEA